MRSVRLIDRVRRTIDRYSLLTRGDRVIVGVSAGVDSMVLLHLLNQLCQDFSLSLIIAHLNHGLRPEESKREAELVQEESLRLGLPLEYEVFNVREFQEAKGISLQDAARRVRFQFFHQLLKKHRGDKIALGHHADDQVETLLLRLLRGSGLKGLKGMLPIREGKVIRPLIEAWKEEIEAFALENSIAYLLDSSNLEGDYLRNRIRHKLIPLIEKEYRHGFRRAVLRTSARLRDEDDFVEKEAEKAFEKIAHQEERELSFKFSDFQSLPKSIQWRVLQKALERIGKGSDVEEGEWSDVNAIQRELQKPLASFSLELSRDLFIEKRYDNISLKRGKSKPIPPFEVELLTPGRTSIQEIGVEVLVEERLWRTPESIGLSTNVAFLDYEHIHFPLRMRNFRPGDRFHPLGAKGTQKLKEFFIDHKIPRMDRPHIPLLISGEAIAWVVGHRIDERFKVTPKTIKVLRVEVFKNRLPLFSFPK